MKLNDWFKLAMAVIVIELVGAAGAIFTAPAIPAWYEGIVKPFLNPPSWVFGPAWTLLYLLMGIAAFLIWRHGYKKKKVKRALSVFAVQLGLNAIWTPIFFGAQNPALAFVDIVLLWIAILYTILLFYKISRPAAYLLIPYILWVSFASYLNLSIWILN
ncbi:tryptophan-rich sensory protein [Candidatus Uhrbacteria bacterium]|jgi:translocator protein|nr:tryptophan-rich sensory protein [Candidatus Uhrbacteria bacterium]